MGSCLKGAGRGVDAPPAALAPASPWGMEEKSLGRHAQR